MSTEQAPIFIIGVPRSGTTLLRTMLDSHPAIACGPETPWLCGHQPRSVMELCRYLWESEHGYCASFRKPREVVTSAAREFVSTLLGEYARGRGKRRWAEKTPDNALYVKFLKELFPDSKFLYLMRDGLDVAVSTSHVSEERKGISAWHEANISFGGGAVSTNNVFNALLRWKHWNRIAEQALAATDHLCVRYEDLVLEPEAVLQQICAFVGEEYDAAMLEYGKVDHDLPAWEWGTADIRTKPTVTTEPLARARRELSATELELLAPIAGDGIIPSQEIEPAAALGFVGNLREERYVQFMRWMNQFSKPLGLRTFVKWSKNWEYPRLWLGAISRLNHQGLRVVDLGTEMSPMPWILGMLGAKVTLIETTDRFIPKWEVLRQRLRVDVDWKITESERIPVEDGAADLLTSFSVIEHQPDKEAAIAEAARTLRPGGIFALSFDICEPQMGMVYPESYGKALTLAEFDQHIWRHKAFGNTAPPQWIRHHMRGFLEWHKRGSEIHNYVVGAAVMVKR